MNLADTIRSVQLFLFDMDGTLYLGNRLYSFTTELLQKIQNSGKRYLFMTNNSSKSVDDYILKLQKMGISATADDFMTSSQATACFLKKQYPDRVLYVCGTESLKRELRKEGFCVSEDITKTQCIVMGFDTELSFQKLHDVSYLLLTNPELPYIATNPDLVCPTEFGSVPDCGSVCQMIYNATGKRPLVIGKPAALMPQLAMERLNVKPEHTCVIGDRIYTDIKSGIAAGVVSVLVLSGETTEEILNASDVKPHFVLQDAGEMIDYIDICR